MIPWWGLAVLILGANFMLWGSIGVCRLSGMLVAKVRARRASRTGPAGDRPPGPAAHQPRRARPLTVRDVAVLIPAHNEAVVIADTLRSIMALVPPGNVHVVSDASTDGTVDIARQAGANVIETSTNVGKAGALREAMDRFGLIHRFRVVMLLDADTRVEPGYFDAGLPVFDNPEVVAVAGCVRTAEGRQLSPLGRVLVGHRQRIYAIGQRVLKFGQTWLRTNATHIVPGFASMYRTDVLPHIEMNPPGLVIEDFNMTFEIYQKRLGKVGFTLSAVAVTQDPGTFRDYVRQTRRWAVGLWQTVRRHPPRANLFTAMLALLLLELVISSLLFLLLPLLLVTLTLPDLAPGTLAWSPFAQVHQEIAAHMTLSGVFFGVLVPDLALTCAVAVLDRRPGLLLIGLAFPVLRLVDAAIGLAAIPIAWFSASTGRWKSPARRVVPAGPPDPEALEPASAPALAAAGAARQADAQRLRSRLPARPVPRSSERPAASRDHWAVGRPLVRN